MNVRIFGISDKAMLTVLPVTALSPSWQEDDGNRWIDVEAATSEELRELLAPLELHYSILDACLDSRRSERLISRQAALYMEVPTHLGWDQVEKPYLSILCLKTTIITIHRDPLHTIEDIIGGVDAEVPLYSRDSSALLQYLLLEIGRRTVDAALDVRAEAERLDQTCHEQPEALDPQVIATLRRKASHYSAVHDDHTYCAGLLQTVESEALRVSRQGVFFKEMLQLSAISRQIIDGAGSRVGSLQRDYELALQNRVDSRIQFLTVLSAVLLPLTLISGIYGMNFDDLPGMGIKSGYLIVIGLMLATAAMTGSLLYRKGWFD